MESLKSSAKSLSAVASHCLPQLPTMGRSMRTAQSKSSVKLGSGNNAQPEETVLHINGTSKVIKISNGGVSALTEIKSRQTEESFAPSETSSIKQDTFDSKAALTPSESSFQKSKQMSTANSKGKNALSQQVEVLSTKVDEDTKDSVTTRHTARHQHLPSTTSYVQKRKLAERGNKPLFRKKKLLRTEDQIQQKNSKEGVDDGKEANPEEQISLSVKEPELPLQSEILTVNQNVRERELAGFEELSSHVPREILIFPAEVPSDEQIQKMLAASTDASSLQHPILLAEGDMKWAKVTGHPYWPCMVSKCPFSKLLTRVKGEARAVRLYHVQFFGDECERGWIAEPSFIDFKGKLDFLEKAKESLKKTPKKGQTSYNPYLVKDSRQNAWDIAVTEAEHAASLMVENRKSQFTFQYCFVDKSKKKTKPHTETQKSPETHRSSPTKSRGQKRKRDSSETNIESPAPNLVKRQKLSSNSPKTPLRKGVPFQVYFATNSSAVKREHPDWNEETLRIFLRKQWKIERGVLELPEASIKSPAESKQDVNIVSTSSPKMCLQRGVPFQVYFATHSTVTRENHPDWDAETLRIFLRKQWKLERMVESPEVPFRRSNQPALTHQANKTDVENAVDKKVFQSPVITPDNRTSQPTGLSIGSPVPNEVTGKCRNRSKMLTCGTSSLSSEMADLHNKDTTPQPKRARAYKSTAAVNQEQTITEASSLAGEASDDLSTVSEQEMATLKAKTKAILARKSSQDSDSSSEGKGRKDDESYELEIFKLASTSRIEKDNLCSICEITGDLLDCAGSCGQHFHLTCVNLKSKPDQPYTCAECKLGIHSCFSCKKADRSTVKCSISVCGKYYHEACVKKYRLTRFESKGFVCPLHSCATCAVDNIRNPKAVKGRYYRCIRCPAAYHVGDHCIPAGSIILAGSNIICADHFTPNKALSCHARLNITWCFTCSKGGTLLCCEACPAAYHAECVKMDKTPEEAWYCEECDAGRRPLYGTIVWIKIGNYRWWPGEICHPRNVPTNIQEKSHQVGEFPVRFFGSHDYYWIHRGRVFLFQEGDKASRDSSAKGLFKTYVKGVKEATEAFKIWTAVKDKKDVQEQERNDKRPPPYKFIKANIPIGNVQIYKADPSEVPICECKPDQTDPCTSDCLNRMMLYECDPATCPVGEKCNNQRFQKREYVDVEPCKCENRGWGLRCLQDVKKGQFVLEYVGDLIDEEECKKRIEQAHDDNITNFYMLTLDKNRIIDAGPKGNCSRFMNHSCCPNLVTQKWTINGDIRVGLFALKDIPKGSELTFNYNLECLGNEKKACACGAENCSGFLGVRPKATVAAGAAKEKLAKELKKKRKKKKLEQRKIYEDECFRCGVGGELVMCDVGNCTKVYHLHCLKLTKPPIGKWRCPWHHCDVCGKHAVNKCVECPDSFCLNHSEGNIFERNGVQVCEDHIYLLDEIKEHSSKALAEATLNSTQVKQAHAHKGLPIPALMESSVSENLPSSDCSPKLSNAKEGNSQEKVKRKYTKRCKSQLVDSVSNKCPILKITLSANQQSNSESESIDSVKNEGGSRPESKSRARKKNHANLEKGKVEVPLVNGLHMSLSSPVNVLAGKLKPHLDQQGKDSDEADSTSSLVIDLP